MENQERKKVVKNLAFVALGYFLLTKFVIK